MRIVYSKKISHRRYIFTDCEFTYRAEHVFPLIKTIDKRNNEIKAPVADHRRQVILTVSNNNKSPSPLLIF